MTVIRLKPEYIKAILEDEELRVQLAKACNKSGHTIYRWARENAAQLTMLSVLIRLREFLKLPKDTVVTCHEEIEEAIG